MPFLTLSDGPKLFYRVEGPVDAPVVIFSNSLGTDHTMWRGQADALSSRMRVVRYDQRGHGASDVPRVAISLERLGRDVIDLADHVGAAKFTFCGISMGGITGQWLAANRRERIDKLILANTSAHFPPPEMWDQRISLIKARGMTAIEAMVMDRFFSERFHYAAPLVVAAFREVLTRMEPAGYMACCNALKVADMRQHLATIDTPTLVICGKYDQSTPPDRGEFIAGRISGAELMTLDAAHLSNVEQPEAFNRAMGRFLLGSDLPMDADYAGALARRREVLGEEWVQAAIDRRSSFNADFQDLITRYAWGAIWRRPGLGETERRLIVLAITAALGRWEEFDLHIAAAARAGVSADAIKEVLLQTAIYAGVPAANTAIKRAEPVLTGSAGGISAKTASNHGT